MKKVLLLGDSIRMGYDKAVKRSLEGKAEVYFPQENCRFASYLLRHTLDYRMLNNNQPFDVIHWNAGLWDNLHLFGEDPHTPLDVYAYYIDRICIRLKKLYPNAKIIFATSTKVQSEKMDKDFKRYNEEIEEYNRTAVEVVQKHGFAVNDLYAVSDTLPEEAHSDSVHYYTPLGTEVFTNAVLVYLKEALGIKEELAYKEELYTDEPIGI